MLTGWWSLTLATPSSYATTHSPQARCPEIPRVYSPLPPSAPMLTTQRFTKFALLILPISPPPWSRYRVSPACVAGRVLPVQSYPTCWVQPSYDNRELISDRVKMEDQRQYCLKWNNHPTNISLVFDRLRLEELFVDVDLATQDRQVSLCELF